MIKDEEWWVRWWQGTKACRNRTGKVHFSGILWPTKIVIKYWKRAQIEQKNCSLFNCTIFVGFVAINAHKFCTFSAKVRHCTKIRILGDSLLWCGIERPPFQKGRLSSLSFPFCHWEMKQTFSKGVSFSDFVFRHYSRCCANSLRRGLAYDSAKYLRRDYERYYVPTLNRSASQQRQRRPYSILHNAATNQPITKQEDSSSIFDSIMRDLRSSHCTNKELQQNKSSSKISIEHHSQRSSFVQSKDANGGTNNNNLPKTNGILYRRHLNIPPKREVRIINNFRHPRGFIKLDPNLFQQRGISLPFSWLFILFSRERTTHLFFSSQRSDLASSWSAHPSFGPRARASSV